MVVLIFATILSLAMSGVWGSDSGCTSQHGHCQEDSHPCTGGSYHSGLCSGHATRRCCIPSGSSGHTCSNVNIIPRATWGARAPKSRSYEHNPLGMFFIHHTDGHECNSLSTCSSQMRGIQNFHMDSRGLRNWGRMGPYIWASRVQTEGWSDIGYSFLVGGDGNIYEGRGWDIVGAHTYGYNTKGYAASFIGTFTNKLPTSAALQAAKNLIACGVQHGKLTSSYKLFGHRQAGSTTCPGDALFAEIQKWPHWTAGHA